LLPQLVVVAAAVAAVLSWLGSTPWALLLLLLFLILLWQTGSWGYLHTS
jgi:hypothetical protein